MPAGIMTRDIAMAHDAALLRLLQLASPALPVGAYSYSEGLEYAIEAGWVQDQDALRGWLRDGLYHGTAHLEAAVLVRVYDGCVAGNDAAVRQWDAWLSAARESEEMRAQSHDMGRSLLRLLRELAPALPVPVTACNFATAFALAAAHWDIAKHAALAGYLASWVGNLIGAGVKLIPLGQTAGQRLLLSLHEDIDGAAARALATADDDLVTSNWGLTLATMNHETQYTRLFRS